MFLCGLSVQNGLNPLACRVGLEPTWQYQPENSFSGCGLELKFKAVTKSPFETGWIGSPAELAASKPAWGSSRGIYSLYDLVSVLHQLSFPLQASQLTLSNIKHPPHSSRFSDPTGMKYLQSDPSTSDLLCLLYEPEDAVY